MTKEFRGLLLYLLIAFGWSWLGWLPSVIISITGNTNLMYWIGESDIGGSPWLWPLVAIGVLSTFGPTAAAFIVTGIVDGKSGVRRLWRRFREFRSAGPWLPVAFLLPFLIVAVPRIIVIPLWWRSSSTGFSTRRFGCSRIQRRTSSIGSCCLS